MPRIREIIRGRSVIPTLLGVAAAIALLVSLALVVQRAGQPGERDWLSLKGTKALAAAPCPSQTLLESDGASHREVALARSGHFRVYGPRLTRLVMPVDWHHDPLEARYYRNQLQKLRFLGPLLQGYAESGDAPALRQAKELALDWVRQNPRGGPNTASQAWVDKTAGDRIPFLAYTIRAAACEGLLRRPEARQFLGSVREHGRFLSDPANYVPSNHGLFVDLGLLRLSRVFPFLEESSRWESRARSRFRRTLHGRLANGIWLEHSTAYQLLVITAVEDFLRIVRSDPALERILARMRARAAWFSRPDGRMTQFGNSYQRRTPTWAVPAVESQNGGKAFLDAGFYFVRTAGPAGKPAYLAVTNGFHNLTHKQADELSFELHDRGRPLITDTGLPSKDPGPDLDFAISAPAHNTLTIDQADFSLSEDNTYGSGLVASGEGNGWFAVEGRNPLVRTQGVRHRRLLLYRPGEVLVVIDSVRAPIVHQYERHLHLAPGVEVETIDTEPDTTSIRQRRVQAWVTDGPIGFHSQRTVVRGQKDPLAGFTYPSFRHRIPRYALTYKHEAASGVTALVIALGSKPLRAADARREGAGWYVTLGRTGDRTERVMIERQGRMLVIHEICPHGNNGIWQRAIQDRHRRLPARAADVGDAVWREMRGRHDVLIRRELQRFAGREVKQTGRGLGALRGHLFSASATVPP